MSDTELIKSSDQEPAERFDWRDYPFAVAIFNPTDADISSIRISLLCASLYKSTIDDGKKIHIAVFDESPQSVSAFIGIFRKASNWKYAHFFRRGIELKSTQIERWSHCYLKSVDSKCKPFYCRLEILVRVISGTEIFGLLVIFPCRHLARHRVYVTFRGIEPTHDSIISKIKAQSASEEYHFCPNMNYGCIEIKDRATANVLEIINDKLCGWKMVGFPEED